MLGFGGRIRCFRGTGSATRVRSARRLPISFLSFLVWHLFDPSRRRPHSLARQRRAIKHLASLAQDQSQLHVAAALIAPNGWRLDLQQFWLAAQPVNPVAILPHQPTNIFQLKSTIWGSIWVSCGSRRFPSVLFEQPLWMFVNGSFATVFNEVQFGEH